MAEMYTARATSVLSPFGGGHCDSHAEPIPVQASKIELQPTIMVDRDLRRADLDAAPSVTEAAHLQERCVDMATELFELKTRFDEQEKELKWAKREAESRERDFKEVHRVCEEERRSSKSFMRRVKTLEEENSKLAADNADLRLDRERLLGVVRRYKDAGRKESVAAHRDRLRKRHMSEKEVNRCDLASAKLGLKAMGQENKRLLSKAKGQASRIRELENGTEVLAKKLSELEHELECAINQKAEKNGGSTTASDQRRTYYHVSQMESPRDAVQQESDKALAQEQRAKSDMEHEALLRLQAVEQASSASRAEEEAKAAKTAAEAVIETLRVKLESTVKKLEAKDSARARHQGSVVRYQKMIDSQAMALQAAREQLLGEKVRRQESERQARLRHIAAIDSKSRAAAGAGATSTRRPASSPTARRPASRAFPASSGQGATRGTWAGRR